MSWGLVTSNWRLKLLALGLAILMLGAVAFSQNPSTVKTLTLGLSYPNATNNPIVLINPPASVTVTARGQSDEIATAQPSNFTAAVDISHARPGSGQRFNVAVSSTFRSGLNVDQPAPIVLNIDTLTTKALTVQVKANPGAGWGITGTPTANPSIVHFTGPASWMTNLQAYASYPGLIEATSNNSINQPVQLQNNTGFVDYNTCGKILLPACSLDITTVALHVDAIAGVTSSTVPLLDLPPTHGPANGYRITAITITPNTVTIQGDPVALGKIRGITLPAVDLTGRTSDATFQVNIPYPDGVSGNVATAQIKYSISPNPAISPSPGP